jgi:uroporphyrinogen decarboxylase
MITPKERVLQALSFQETDFVPYHIMFDEAITLKLGGLPVDPLHFSQFTNHLPFINLESKQFRITPDVYSDEFGSVWKTLNQVPHLIEYPLIKPTLKNYSFPEFIIDEYIADIEKFFADHHQCFVLCGMTQGFYDRGWSLRGTENFLIDFIENPLFVEQLFEALTDYYLKLLDKIARFPFDGIRFGDDWGAQRGMLMGPNRWRQFLKPGLAKIFDKARRQGLVVMVHSDGDIMEIIPDLIEMGVQILNPIQPECMDIFKIKRLFGKKLCLNGGISSQYTLPLGTAAGVRQEVSACLRYLAHGGGYVIGPSKSILADTPFENTVALVETILNQPTKPLPVTDKLPESVPELEKVYKAFH